MNFFQEKLGYTFKNPKLIDEALTHKSFSAEHNMPENNERLEFLGDSVLELVVSGYLYSRFPDKDEGFLSKSRAFLVSRETMAAWAAELKLGFYLRLGAGEILSGGKTRRNNLANAMEAVLGAVYLDGGLEAASAIILDWLKKQKPAEIPEDSKTQLQLIIQKKYKIMPSYETLEESGPEHDKTFKVRVFLGSKTLGLGKGKSLKSAQQAAAHEAMSYVSTHKLTKKDIKLAA
ncbi:MAG: ribonuclease III [Elusimicrobiales bacterium]|nr:ribonuclease III [Elusimicrobiales bacterium]